jgi:hypothetical protein
MFVKLFKPNNPALAFLTPLLVALIWSKSFVSPNIIVLKDNMPLYALLVSGLQTMPAFFVALFSVLLVTVEAVYLNILIAKHEVLYKRTNLPLLVYPILMGLFSEFTGFHPLLIVNLLLLIVMDLTFSLYKAPNAISIQFNIGTCIALISLFYYPASVFFIMLWLNLAIQRPFVWREWVVGLLGLGVVYMFYGLYLFWNNELGLIFESQIDPLLNSSIPNKFLVSDQSFVLLGLIVLLFLLSLFKVKTHFYKNVIRTRSFQLIVFGSLAIAAASFLICRHFVMFHFVILAVPLTFFISYFFLAARTRWWAELLLTLVIVGMLIDRMNLSMSFNL